MFNFVKQKRIYCGNYLEVDIYPRTKNQIETPKGKRPKKRAVSRPAQKNLNAKRAKRYFVQLLNTNFTEADYYMTFTYKPSHHPTSIKDAERNVRNYIARVNYRRKKEGLEKARYISVIEYQLKDNKPVHIHHHIVMDGQLSRDLLEDLWRLRRTKGQKRGEKIGRTNARRLQADENGFAALAHYLCKYEYRKRQWTSSTNLKKPDEKIDDYKWTKRQIEKLVKQPLDKGYWARKFPGYRLTSEDYGYEVAYNELMGWSIYLKLVRDD